MNVKKLIKELKAMPQNMEVGVAMHDNNEGGGASADSPKPDDFANSQDVNGNKINRGE